MRSVHYYWISQMFFITNEYKSNGMEFKEKNVKKWGKTWSTWANTIFWWKKQSTADMVRASHNHNSLKAPYHVVCLFVVHLLLSLLNSVSSLDAIVIKKTAWNCFLMCCCSIWFLFLLSMVFTSLPSHDLSILSYCVFYVFSHSKNSTLEIVSQVQTIIY